MCACLRPIKDPLKAASMQRYCHVYRRWHAGEMGYGPWCIDTLGRVVKASSSQTHEGKSLGAGQLGAMVHDYLQHEVFTACAAKTQKEYCIYLDLFVKRFSETYWHELAPGTARKWLKERALTGGPSGAHALYRTVCAFFGKIRLCYGDVNHPGFVPANRNPFASLDLSPPKSVVVV